MQILIVDDTRASRRTLARSALKLGQVELVEASCLEEGLALLERSPFDVALIDLRLSEDPDNRDGLTLIAEARKRSIVPVVVSGFSDMGEIRAAMRVGAHDFLLKDELSDDLVLPVLEAIRSRRQLEKELIELRTRRTHDATLGMVGTSPEVQRLRGQLQRVATSDRPVLIFGPTGAGKELAVRSIHAMGCHPDAPLLDLNCGAFPASLIESQLFGHERGAFTGAERRQDGFFTAVGRGTLFLDEIAELQLDLQAKLLRVLESGTFRPIGATAAKQFTGRVVAATHVDLEKAVDEGRFRADLFYRLNVLEVHVPALADRREDIPALVAHFAAMNQRPLVFSDDAIAHLSSRSWPGNIRELRNLIERVAVFAPDGPIDEQVILSVGGKSRVEKSGTALAELARAVLRGPEPDKLRAVETALVEEALRLTGGRKAAAARLLGVHRKAIERRVERLYGRSHDGEVTRDEELDDHW
jgi:DNA-binding NtrC family response regulator